MCVCIPEKRLCIIIIIIINITLYECTCSLVKSLYNNISTLNSHCSFLLFSLPAPTHCTSRSASYAFVCRFYSSYVYLSTICWSSIHKLYVYFSSFLSICIEWKIIQKKQALHENCCCRKSTKWVGRVKVFSFLYSNYAKGLFKQKLLHEKTNNNNNLRNMLTKSVMELY